MNVRFAAYGGGIAEVLCYLFDHLHAARFGGLDLVQFMQREDRKIGPGPGAKILGVISRPETARRYSFTSPESMLCRLPSSSMYWNNSEPGRSRHLFTIRASLRSLTMLRCRTPLLARKSSSTCPPLTRT